MEQNYHYYAFISYNHRDEKVAKWLQARLEHYKLPAVARKEIGEDVKIRPVFRYVSDLGVAVLREKIKQELESSKYLIVICSPHSAKPNVKGEHWVNDEVKRFSEMGRKDRIIPVIVDGVPGDIERECFCPALAAAEIAGVDFQKEKKLICLQKIVAKLLGLRPDILIQRYLEEQKKRRRRLFLEVLPFFAILSLGGLFVWDAVRPVSLYFADYVDCYGLPEGIYEVPKRDLRTRSSTYRFDYHGYYLHGVHLASLPQGLFGIRRKLKRVVHVGPTDVPSDLDDFEWLKKRPVIMTFVYDDENRMMTKIVRKRGGKDFVSGPIVKLIHFSNRVEAGKTVVNGHIGETFEDGITPYFMRGSATQAAFIPDDKYNPQKNTTRIAYANIGRDILGRMTSIRFLDPNKEAASDAEGVAGHEYVLTESHGEYPGGAIKEIYHLDENGRRHANQYGVATTRYERQGPCVTMAEHRDASGVPVIGDSGYFRTVVSYDANGKPTSQVMKNRYDNPAYRVSRGKSDDGWIESMSEWSSRSMEYENGLLSKMRFYRPDGRLVDRKGFVAIVKASYNRLGDPVDMEFFDSNTNRMVCKEGLSRMRFEPDPSTGEIMSVRCFDEHDNPSYGGGELSFRRDFIYDVNTGNEKETRCLDENGDLMTGGSGCAIARYEYDGQGRLKGMSFYDMTTNSCVIKEFGGNVGRLTIKYQGKGRNEERHEFWTDDTCAVRARAADGHYGVLLRFDNSGRMTEKWNLDENGCVPRSSKWAGVLDKLAGRNADAEPVGFKCQYGRIDSREEIVPGRFAEKGFREVITTFYLDAETLDVRNGYCTRHDITDIHGNLVFQIFRNGKGERVDCEDTGYAVVANAYDDVGQHVGSFYYDKTGGVAIDKTKNIAGEIFTHKDVPYKTQTTTYLGVDLKSASCPTGEVFSTELTVDKGNGVVETSYWHEGKAVRCANGYHLERVKRNIFGLPEEQSFFDEHGNRCTSKKYGFSQAICEYDALRQEVRAYRYDEKGFLCHIEGQAFCVKEWDYDSMHRETEVRFIGQEIRKGQLPKYGESPGYDEFGISRITKSYYGNSHIILRQDEFSLTNAPCLYGNTGVWHKVTLYDVAGRETNECFYAVSGRRTNCMDGYAECACKYDADGHVIEAVGFDADGKKVIGVGTQSDDVVSSDGGIEVNLSPAAVVAMPDWQWLKVFDLSSVASLHFKVEESNGKVLSAYFAALDKNGKPMLIPNGFSEGKVKNNERGIACRRDFYALPGEGGVWGASNVHHEVRWLDEKGRVTNECYYAVSGAPTTNRSGMVRCEIAYNAKDERIAIFGYDKDGNRLKAKMFVVINDVLPNSAAEKGGMKKGDIICAFSYGTNVVDFSAGTLSDSTFAQWQKTIAAAKDVEKTIVFARRVEEDFVIDVRTFPKGIVGFAYGQHPVFENAYTKLQGAMKRQVESSRAEESHEVRNEQSR